MLARTHVNLGFLVSQLAKVSLPVGPTTALLLVFNLAPAMFRIIVLAAAFVSCIIWPARAGPLMIPLAIIVGSIVLDLDEPNSTGAWMIAPTELVLRILMMGAGATVIWAGWGLAWAMAAGAFLVLTGVLNLKVLPMETLQRVVLIVVGIALITWAHNHVQLWFGVLYLMMGILSHRGLTHSLEGIAMILVGAYFFTQNTGHPGLFKPIAIGVAVHYLADLFADHGVYLTYFGKIKISFSLIKTMSFVDRLIGLSALVMVLYLIIGGIDGRLKSVIDHTMHNNF